MKIMFVMHRRHKRGLIQVKEDMEVDAHRAGTTEGNHLREERHPEEEDHHLEDQGVEVEADRHREGQGADPRQEALEEEAEGVMDLILMMGLLHQIISHLTSMDLPLPSFKTSMDDLKFVSDHQDVSLFLETTDGKNEP